MGTPDLKKTSNKSAEVKSFIHRIGREELGEPKAKPGASLPRSERNRQFLPASRFIWNVSATAVLSEIGLTILPALLIRKMAFRYRGEP